MTRAVVLGGQFQQRQLQQQPPQQQQLCARGSFPSIILSIFTFENIYKAYLDCRAEKRTSRDALLFELNQEQACRILVDELNNRTYTPLTSVCFYLDKPKTREIFAADFRDRIVHHLIYNHLAPVWEKIFIDQSFACRPEKGTHKGARVLQNYCRKITKNGKQKAYYLKMDVANFFMTINKKILYDILRPKCIDPDLDWLIRTCLFHDPTRDVRMVNCGTVPDRLPAHKSLFNAAPFCGLPIGNLTSQFFANVYLNELDHYVKHVLKCRYYVRYVDDMVLLALSMQQLLRWYDDMVTFLKRNLQLGINHDMTSMGSIYNGVDFVGFIVRPFYLLARRRVIGNFKIKLQHARPQFCYQKAGRVIWHYDREKTDHLLATVNSYLGHLGHAASKSVIDQIVKKYGFLTEFFYLDGHRVVYKVKPPKSVRSLADQVRFYKKHFPDYLLLFQVGCYYEAFGDAAKHLSTLTGYNIKEQWRGFKIACGFHNRLLNKVLKLLDEQKIPVVIFKQTGRVLLFTMERLPEYKIDYGMN